MCLLFLQDILRLQSANQRIISKNRLDELPGPSRIKQDLIFSPCCVCWQSSRAKGVCFADDLLVYVGLLLQVVFLYCSYKALCVVAL